MYTNDNLVCVKAKAQGEAFSIDDWTPSSDMNSATKKIFESLIEQLDNRITLQVTAHDELKETVTALGIRMDGAEEQITIYANKINTLEGTVTQLGLDLDAAEGSISAIAGLFDEDGHLIEGSGWVTTTQYNSLYSVVQDIDGALSAKAEVRTSVQYDPNTGAVTSAIKLTADKISLEGITTINDSFSVGTDGTTRIAGFVVSGNGLTNRDENGTFTNDAYVIFRNDAHGCFAGIGGNILPASSGIRGVARFENHDTTDQWALSANYALLVSAQGGRDNVAISINGGAVSGMAMKNTIISTSTTSKTLARNDYNVIAINTNDCTLTLPTMELYDDGHVIRIKRLGSGTLKIKLGYCYTWNGSTSRYTRPVLIYNQNSKLVGTDTIDFPSVCDSFELVWCRDINYTIDNTEYYGAWVQYKLPRDW